MISQAGTESFILFHKSKNCNRQVISKNLFQQQIDCIIEDIWIKLVLKVKHELLKVFLIFCHKGA